jgi:hypothetical protein
VSVDEAMLEWAAAIPKLEGSGRGEAKFGMKPTALSSLNLQFISAVPVQLWRNVKSTSHLSDRASGPKA